MSINLSTRTIHQVFCLVSQLAAGADKVGRCQQLVERCKLHTNLGNELVRRRHLFTFNREWFHTYAPVSPMKRD
jgi:hypothetical protein